MISFFSTYFKYIFSKFKIKHHRLIENILSLGILVIQYMNMLKSQILKQLTNIFKSLKKPKKKLSKWGLRAMGVSQHVSSGSRLSGGERSLLCPLLSDCLELHLGVLVSFSSWFLSHFLRFSISWFQHLFSLLSYVRKPMGSLCL